MTARRWRAGEWLAGAGAVVLVVVLFLPWFDAEGAPAGAGVSRAGVAALGWPLVACLALTVALAAWLLVATAAGAPVSHLLGAGVLTISAAFVALLWATVRVAITQPALGAGLGDEAVTVGPAAYAGLAALAAILAGAWHAVADERTDAPESAYVPPPARRAPPAES